MFKKKYEIIQDAPAPISWDTYAQESYREYHDLLQTRGNEESVFQDFFERHPSFVPGAFELFGTSGHYPHTQSLIAEPQLNGGLFTRIPDFIWLAQDSLFFTPVLIEIEKPNKKTFTTNGVQSAEFTQALGQIAEWKAILSEPENVLQFYRCFNIPDWIRKKTFAPQYGLIFGRRSEFEADPLLLKKRAQLVPDDVKLISFDRLSPDPKGSDLLCATLSKGKYTVKTVPPTYRYSPATADNFSVVSGFDTAIRHMEMTTSERKEFLVSRYAYWKEYGEADHKGILCPADRE